MDLSGFKAFDFSEGMPYFSVTQNGLTFNKSVTQKIGCPSHARLLINSETSQLVLQACTPTTPQAVTYYKPRQSGVLSVRWNSKDLISTIQRLLNADFEKDSFRVEGELVDEGTMLFDLKKAKQLSIRFPE